MTASPPHFQPNIECPNSDLSIAWLTGLAEKGGKGVVGNIDARSLGRIADELEGWKSSHASLKARIEELTKALRFYADPFAWKKQHDPADVIRVPDFYSETSFGDTAIAALPSSTPAVTG